MTISFDGLRHDNVRLAPGNTQSILTFLEHKPSYTEVSLQMTLGPWNMSIDDVEYVINVSEKFHTTIRFNVAADSGLLGKGSYNTNLTKIKELLPLIEYRLGSNHKSVKYLYEVINALNGNRLPCTSTNIYSTIMANGDVWMCQGLSEAEAKLGNIYETNYDDIWHSSQQARDDYYTCNKCILSCQLMGDIKLRGEYEQK